MGLLTGTSTFKMCYHRMPEVEQMLRTLEASDAPLIWHKHSSFLDHLRGVWLMLVAWEQPRAVCRLVGT